MDDTGKFSKREQERQKIKNKLQQLHDEDLIFIPAREPVTVTGEVRKKRVCAYCRVSTDDPAQTTSYELQKEHYEEEINKNPDWIYAGIYADEGISATSLKHRDNFNRMIAAAEAGKIDIIVTKAVSRFARNVVDCLSVVRHLAKLNPPVGVRFETEGINTLDSTSEMILAVMASAAQEESKTKSNSMNWSLENRFKKGKFLTPVLLGYDHDEDGNLVINEDEAKTVRMIFYMYLAGYPLKEIADILMDLERETKPGNTKWTGSTVRSILKNERHCGNVLSWKTYTYDFWEHLKRKNNHNKPQVLKVDHHEGIVSHEVFDAVQTKLESEKYMKKGIPLPALEVVDSGALKGYVSVNRLWSGFSDEDYSEASESAYKKEEDREAVSGLGECHETFSLDGYQIVRSDFFSDSSRPYMNIAKGKVRFNAACMKRFETVEYVELLFNSVEKCIAIRPCTADNPNAIRWGSLKNSKWRPASLSCSGFSGPLYSMMDWEANCGYKLRGQYISDGEDQVLFFDLSDPEITIFEKIPLEREAGEDIDNIEETEYIIQKKEVLPDSWGSDANTSYIEFKEKYYDGNWSIMQPTRIFRICGDLSETVFEKITREVEALYDEFAERIAE